MKAGSIHDSPTKAPPFARFKSPSSPDANQQPEHNLEIEQLEALVVESQGTPNDEESIQRWIDWLDESIAGIRTYSAAYARAVRRLQVLCRKAGRLPSSCILSSEVVLDSAEPYSKSAFSDVYLAHLGESPVALKALRIHVDSKAKVERAFYSEAVIWRSLRHPNVVPFLGVSATMSVCLISAWMPNGSVTAYLVAHPEAQRVKLLQNVVNGLEYIHSLGVVHGDLKAANILINTNHEACLADFGLATMLHQSGTTTGASSLKGTLRWMAPELLECEDADGGSPTTASDVYATAMIFYEVFSGKYPFHELRHDAAVLRRILNGGRPERPLKAASAGLTDVIWKAMERCWAAEPNHRASLLEVAQCLIQDEDINLNETAIETSSDIGIAILSAEDGRGGIIYYKLEEPIGEGRLGAVYRARQTRSGLVVAIKQIHLDGLQARHLDLLSNTVKDLCNLPSNINLLTVEGMAVGAEALCLVLEYAHGGSLEELLRVAGPFGETSARRHISAALDGLKFLHEHLVVHGDLRAANILTTHNGQLKLCNYGLLLREHLTVDSLFAIIPPNWTAPEVFEHNATSPESDIWSLACTAIELLTGHPPYADVPVSTTVVRRILQDDMPPLPTKCSDKAKEFLVQCLTKSSSARPSAHTLSLSEWAAPRKAGSPTL